MLYDSWLCVYAFMHFRLKKDFQSTFIVSGNIIYSTDFSILIYKQAKFSEN